MSGRLRTIVPIALFSVLLCAGTILNAQQEAPPIDPAALETFFDDYMTGHLASDHIAGAAVSVVGGGRMLFGKGYGYADLERKVPVDPGKTVFVLGSLTKVFTWTAVMQLAERGALDLRADVNKYLDFMIPATYPEPVTLENLASHASGFEDAKFAQVAPTSDGLQPLGKWLKTHIPARVFPPGKYVAYGNYGTALAGYVVERVSGMGFDDYIDANILVPLGMKSTSTRQPAPESFAGNMSKCYSFRDGAFREEAVPANIALNTAPAGSAKSTAADMAAFMLAQLNDGRHAGPAVLPPESTRYMHGRGFSFDPRVNGTSPGFWELDMNGENVIGHAGSHFIFNSFLMLFPDRDLGVFIVTNSSGGTAILGENFPLFQRAFVERFFPRKSPESGSPDALGTTGLDGSYRMTFNRSETTFERMFDLMRAVRVRSSADGLLVSMPSGIERFVEIEPLLFRRDRDDALLVFNREAGGGASASFGEIPITALVRNRWFETPDFNLTLLGLSLLLFISYPFVAAFSFLRGRSAADRNRSAVLLRASRLTALGTSLVNTAVVILTFASLFDVYGLYTGNLPLWSAVRILSILSVPLAAGTTVFAATAWSKRSMAVATRIHYSLLSAGALFFVWFMLFWNILGSRV